MLPRRLLSPRDWPLSAKLASAVVVLALVPLLAVALFDVRDVESQAVARETDALQKQASDAALRLAERVQRLRAYAEVAAASPVLVRAVDDAGAVEGPADARAWDQRHPGVYPVLESLRNANPWFQHVYVLNERGVCIGTSEREVKPDMFGRNYSYRPYFTAPSVSGRSFVSDVLKNATSAGTAIFVSAPVEAPGAGRAVAVIKVDTDALHDVVGELSGLGRRALFLDRFGVVVSDARDGVRSSTDDPRSLQFHPVAPVSKMLPQFRQSRRYGDPDGEHYLDRVQTPLPLDELWSALRSKAAGAREEALPLEVGGETEPTVVGHAPVWSGEDEPYGYLVLGQPSAQFREPLERIGQSALYRFLAVLVAVAVVMAVAIGRLAGRVSTLADATAAVAEGGSPLRWPDAGGDELGALAGSVAQMAKRLAEAQTDAQSERDDADEARAAAARAEKSKRALIERLARDPAGAEATLEIIGLLAGGELELELDRTTFDLRPLLDEAVATVRATADLGGSTIEVDAIEAELSSDRERLLLAVAQLLDNAARYTRKGTVTVRARRSDDRIEVEIADTGIGITPQQLAKLFDAEPTLPDGVKTPLGLGIPIARKTIDLLGGTLSARSEPGQGTTITVTLPT